MLARKHRFTTRISVLLHVVLLATSLASFMAASSQMKEGRASAILLLTSGNICSKPQKDLIPSVFISLAMAAATFLRDKVLSGERDTAQLTKYPAEFLVVLKQCMALDAFHLAEKIRQALAQENSGNRTKMHDETRLTMASHRFMVIFLLPRGHGVGRAWNKTVNL